MIPKMHFMIHMAHIILGKFKIELLYNVATVEYPNKGHFGTCNINSSGLSTTVYRDCPLLRDSNCIILIGGLKFGYLVLSIVERYLIQCPLFGVSVKRDSTVVVILCIGLVHYGITGL